MSTATMNRPSMVGTRHPRVMRAVQASKTEIIDENDLCAPEWAKKEGITYADFQRTVTKIIKQVKSEERQSL